MLNNDTTHQVDTVENYRDRITNFSNDFDLGLFIHIVKRSLVWVILCTSLGLASAYVYIKYTAPVYKSSAVIQLSKSDNATKVLNVGNIYEEGSILAEIELLRSNFLVKQAIATLPLEVSYYTKGNILTYEHYQYNAYLLDDLVVHDSTILDHPIFISFLDQELIEINYILNGRDYKFNFGIDDLVITDHFDCKIVQRNKETIDQLKDENIFYFKFNNINTLTNKYASKYNIQILNANAKTISILCVDNNPILAKDLVQALADRFIEYDLERRSKSAESILNFINVQRDTVFEKLKASETLLQTFQKENRVNDMRDMSAIFIDRLNERENELLELEIEQNLLNEIEKSTDKSITDIDVYNLIPLLVGTDYENTLSELINDLHSLLLEREEIYFEVTPKNERVRALEYQIEIQKRLIIESIKTLNKRVGERKKNIQIQLDEFENNFFGLPAKELEFARIQRLFNINEKYYTRLLEKDIEYRISLAGFVPENRLLEDPRLPVHPISPKVNVIYTSFLMAGVLFSLLIIVIKYLFHNNITSLNDVSKLSNASIGILGMIPKYKKEIPISQLLVDKNPKSLIAESFRTVRTNLQFIDNSAGPKVIAITSTISGEGKTFVAINLAGIIAFSNKRVLVIDLDMRKPKIHLGFGVDNIKGMSTLLIGKDKFRDCIQHSKLNNLDFITAGPIPPNPSELIISEMMDHLLAEFKDNYDIVIIDNPPVGLVTDGITMIQKADYPIYVFRADYSKKQFVQNVDRLINEHKFTKISTILNGVDIDRNKYGYNYGYGYGYGYGYTDRGYGYGYGYYQEINPMEKKKRFGFLSHLKRN